MILQTIAFYLFSVICVASGVMVVSARNPVHSVLFLILAFFNAAGLFVLMGAEFLAMILVIVYVGAVAVLFLFVVMMLDIDLAEMRQGAYKYLPVGLLVGFVLVAEILFVIGAWVIGPDAATVRQAPTPSPAEISNTAAIGRILYTQYLYLFQISGMVLLVAMIGAIVLTLRRRAGVRRQRIVEQVTRQRSRTLEIVKVPSGEGV